MEQIPVLADAPVLRSFQVEAGIEVHRATALLQLGPDHSAAAQDEINRIPFTNGQTRKLTCIDAFRAAAFLEAHAPGLWGDGPYRGHRFHADNGFACQRDLRMFDLNGGDKSAGRQITAGITCRCAKRCIEKDVHDDMSMAISAMRRIR